MAARTGLLEYDNQYKTTVTDRTSMIQDQNKAARTDKDSEDRTARTG